MLLPASSHRAIDLLDSKRPSQSKRSCMRTGSMLPQFVALTIETGGPSAQAQSAGPTPERYGSSPTRVRRKPTHFPLSRAHQSHSDGGLEASNLGGPTRHQTWRCPAAPRDRCAALPVAAIPRRLDGPRRPRRSRNLANGLELAGRPTAVCGIRRARLQYSHQRSDQPITNTAPGPAM